MGRPSGPAPRAPSINIGSDCSSQNSKINRLERSDLFKIDDILPSNLLRNKKIGFIKDISAGAASFAAVISLIVACFIYAPKIAQLF